MFTINLEDGREAPFKASLYIYFACMYVCLHPINVKTAEPIGHTFCMGPHGRFMDDQNFKF